jgi:DNA (cytosine-5)-methyltransferase 1
MPNQPSKKSALKVMLRHKARLTASQQVRLLRDCSAKGGDLSSRLAKIGLSRDLLTYEVNGGFASQHSKAKTLADFRKPFHGTPVISLFSGCGGMDLGFEAAGYEHTALIEHNELFCSTLRRNRPSWRVIGPPDYTGDVSDRAEIVKILIDGVGVKAPFPGVLVGGPPCQPFSIASNQRFSKAGANFKRVGFNHEKNGNLLFDMIWLIGKLSPAAFVIENVEGLYDVDGGEQLQIALQKLTRLGYGVAEPLVLDAAHYQVPQHRRRLFICGNRLMKKFAPLKPSFDLVACMSVLGGNLNLLSNHDPRNHHPESLIRYMKLGFGQRDHLGRVDRLDPTKPSKTVIAGGTNGGGRSHLHPLIPRTLSARECARLQTFPDDFVFNGPSARQFTQVGNAVPPILAAQLAESVYNSVFTK